METEEDYELRLVFRDLPTFVNGTFLDCPHFAGPDSSPRSRLRQRMRQQENAIYRLDDPIYLPVLTPYTRRGYHWQHMGPNDATLWSTEDDKPATLSVVGTVSRDGTCVQPHARYRQPSPSVPSLSDAQLRIRLIRPDKPFSRDFVDSIDTISWWIEQQCCKDIGWTVKGVTRGDSWRSPGKIKSLQFEHRLFEKVVPGDFPLLDKSFTEPWMKFSIAGWPVLPEAAEEHESMVASRRHKVCPLPATDEHGVRLLPSEWPRIICDNALVEISFCLHHTIDREFRCDHFTGIIDSVRVLEKGRSEVVYSDELD
ncbi:hypothetical protein V5O48_005837 [Marasmius crinis-equi]|uniref:Uncharacterized protein n=1 Tax=Marasmius crinis-equi TaxID=585013 RepID=A0ABR3FLA5_9AGAR